MSPEMYAAMRAAADALRAAIKQHDLERDSVRDGMQAQLDSFERAMAAHDQARPAPKNGAHQVARRGRKTNAEVAAMREAEAARLYGESPAAKETDVAWSDLDADSRKFWLDEGAREIERKRRRRTPAPAATPPAPAGNGQEDEADTPPPRHSWPSLPHQGSNA